MHWTIQDWEIQDMIRDYKSSGLTLYDWRLLQPDQDRVMVVIKYIEMIRDYESSGKTPSKWILEHFGRDRADARGVIEYLKNNGDSSSGVLIRCLEVLRPWLGILTFLRGILTFRFQ